VNGPRPGQFQPIDRSEQDDATTRCPETIGEITQFPADPIVAILKVFEQEDGLALKGRDIRQGQFGLVGFMEGGSAKLARPSVTLHT
jgi:hypothetical protein